MSPERDDPDVEQEFELYEDVAPRSIFAATWFRVVLVVIVLGVIGAVAVPYVLDWMSPPPAPRSAATTKPSATSTSAPAVSTADKALSSERSTGEKSASDKPAGDKRDSTMVPAPTSSPLAATPARPETKSESAAAKPPVEPKSVAKSTPSEAKASTPTESKTAMAVTESPTKTTATRRAALKAPTPAPPSAVASDAPYWVQVGAFKDPEMAKRVARKLRDENFKVEESLKSGVAGPTAPAAKTPAATSGSEQYDVFVSGAAGEDLKGRLASKGLTVEETPSGSFLVKPSQSLRDAVALSKDLAVDGLKVQVRRAGSATTASSAPAAGPPLEGGAALHRVRVGAFPDKSAAQAAARELEAKGYRPFIARGDQ